MRRLSPADAALVELSAAIAGGWRGELREALEAAVATAPAAEVEEAILQAYLFVGFPATLEAMRTWREVRGAPPVPDEDPLREPRDLVGWRERGEEACRRVYGAAYERLREAVRRLHPALDRWMIEEGYGKVLGRPGLDAARRELCSVALLAVTGHERQLHSHLRGALHAGAAPDAVEEALERGLRRASDASWVEAARGRWRQVRPPERPDW